MQDDFWMRGCTRAKFRLRDIPCLLWQLKQPETSALSAEIRGMKNMLRDLLANSSISSTHKESDEPSATRDI
jgi:hypothetical protein